VVVALRDLVAREFSVRRPRGGPGSVVLLSIPPGFLVLWYFGSGVSAVNGVTLRTQKVIQGSDTGHVGCPCEVSLALPCPELFCGLRIADSFVKC